VSSPDQIETSFDRQIEADAQNGNLDRLYSRLIEEEGREPTVPLEEFLNALDLS
jgi:hypothetical protein